MNVLICRLLVVVWLQAGVRRAGERDRRRPQQERARPHDVRVDLCVPDGG